MILDEDISFVVQGPIRVETKQCLNSIRTWFPNSKIILSTWENEDISNLDYDDIVFSEDPGSLDITINGEVVAKENTNRQIVSTYNGLDKVKTEYCMKIRSDNIVTSSVIIDEYAKSLTYKRQTDCSWLKERIIISGINTVDPKSFIGYVYQISDWFFFGKTEDVKDYWKQELIENVEYYTNQSAVGYDKYRGGFNFGRFSAEQNIALGFIKKHTDISCNHYRDHDNNNVQKTVDIIINNFYSIEPNMAGISFPKYSRFIDINYKSISDLKSYIGFWSTTVTNKLWNIYYKQLFGIKTSFSDKLYMITKRFAAFLLKIKSYR